MWYTDMLQHVYIFQVVEYESAVTARDAVFSELSKAGAAGVAHRVCVSPDMGPMGFIFRTGTE